MSNWTAALMDMLRPRLAAFGLAGAVAITLTWWFVVARGLWLAIEWAAV